MTSIGGSGSRGAPQGRDVESDSEHGSAILGPQDIRSRKREHLELGLMAAAVSAADPGWDDVHLVPSSVPEISPVDIESSTTFLGRVLQAPILISGMTGGHEDAAELNATLAAAAERLGIAMGVGSQRAALLDPSLVPGYAIARERAPGAFLVANLGMAQLVEQDGEPPFDHTMITEAVDMIAADALAIHLNAVEEMIQPEGNRNTAGVLRAIGDVVTGSDVPVIAKETGAGMSRETSETLARVRVAALDVGGAGGTSFAKIEGIRAARRGDVRGQRLGETFSGWGLSTVVSVLETRGTGLPVIATGGIRNGLHAAKAFALGADMVGIGSVALRAAERGLDALLAELEFFLEELRLAMLLCAAPTPRHLTNTAPVLTGLPEAWARQRKGVPIGLHGPPA